MFAQPVTTAIAANYFSVSPSLLYSLSGFALFVLRSNRWLWCIFGRSIVSSSFGIVSFCIVLVSVLFVFILRSACFVSFRYVFFFSLSFSFRFDSFCFVQYRFVSCRFMADVTNKYYRVVRFNFFIFSFRAAQVVKEPMDLKTMGYKVQNGKYKTLQEMRDDCELMSKNALIFNRAPGEVGRSCSDAERRLVFRGGRVGGWVGE